MKEITIEPAVPVPVKRTPHGKHAAMLKAMEDGESAIVSAKAIPNVRSQASRMGIRVVTRRQEDGSYRVWRVN